MLTVAAVLMTSVAGCTLPRGAAMEHEILREQDAQTPSFVHYQVDAALLPAVQHWPAGSGADPVRGWPKGGAGAPGQILARGDMVKLAIWESGENKLLTTPDAPTAALQPSQVSAGGSIFVPYVGPVKVAGLSPEAARQKIQDQVSGMIPSAQVQLEATPGSGNSVDLVGGVAHPGRMPLMDRSLTVLGLISQGGGPSATIENPQVRLMRGGRAYRIAMQRLLDDPALDTGLRPGDKVSVEKDRRYFLALGAAGKQQLINFPKEDLTAIEAVTMAGGINAGRANPKGVLILREYPAAAVRADGKGGPSQQRVVFTMDLTSTDGLFSAQNFTIQPKDLVLATESPLNNTRTVLSLIGSVFGIANTAQNATE
ncbi:polysaccharide biosynthesis/export family protein [Paenirhodobacter sp.]|uniref:polysaccharide biosynthesis/export family protein n=1 Tax=Paenirhodobacter sp. TaxID=1965326 RepID=UPI003B41AE39